MVDIRVTACQASRLSKNFDGILAKTFDSRQSFCPERCTVQKDIKRQNIQQQGFPRGHPP
jgi:hypothetical protein